MERKNKFLSYCILLLIVLYSTSSTTKPSDEFLLQEYRKKLGQMSLNRRFEELIAYASDVSDSVTENRHLMIGDSDGFLLWSWVYMAQSYLFLDDFENTRKYLDLCNEADLDSKPDYVALRIIKSTEALLALKSEMDYSKAMHHLQQALSYAGQSGDELQKVSALCNIANIYYRRGDTVGYKYVSEAMDIVNAKQDSTYLVSVLLNMANMNILRGNYEEAKIYTDRISKLVRAGDNNGIHSLLLVIYGDIYQGLEDYERADSVYKVIASEYMEPSIKSEYYYKYGMLKLRTGKPDEAVGVFNAGLNLTYDIDNIENRHYFLLGLSEAYTELGDSDKAFHYFRNYHNLLDSLSLVDKERDFNRLLMNYSKMDYEQRIHQEEIRNTRITLISIAVIVIILIVLLSVFMSYHRQNEMYSRLVHQYRRNEAKNQELENKLKEYMNSGSKINGAIEEKDRELFLTVEKLMDEERIYKSADLTLDKLSDMLGSNRSYVSRAINNFAGMSFSNYLNKKRLAEAVLILSNPDNDVQLKVLWEDLGYGSVSAFYKAFCKETGCSPKKYQEIIRKN